MDTTENTLSSSPAASGNKMFVFSPEENQLSFKTSDKNITVKCSGGAHDRGSSKIKLIDVVSYKWEVKHYPGRLIACHKECKLFAYAITVTKLSKSEGMVRVAQLQVAERGIIRGLSNEVLDIQFAHTSSPDYLLGIIERTTLQVHQVFVKGNKVTTALKVKIVDPLEGHVPVCDRINWCPYLRENDYEIDDFASQLLVWTRGSTFQCYSISTLTKTYADTSDLKACDIDEGGFKANDADATVTGSVFSADGTTLALSSTDGMIRFYQVYQHANDCTPRRLHQWKPHGGRPVSSFFFLDNYTETVGDKVLWKHAITCADNNTEIRVWCCESWECLQAVRLESPMAQSLNFKAEIDLSSTYLVLSDMNTRQIYVLQIRKGQSGRSGLPSPSSSSRDPDQAQGEPQWKSRTASLARGTVIRRAEQSSIKPHIVSIAEYPISRMILGFSIIYARVGNYLLREQDDDDEDQSLPSCIVIRMFLVQSGVIQDCTLVYDPVDENECDVLAIAEEGNVGAIDCEVDGNDTQTSQSSASSSSSSTETTDNNLSHPPSEASDQSVERKTKAELNASTGAPKASAEESSDGSASGSNSNNDSREDDEEEENGGHGNATSNLLKLKMAEAAQKLNEALDALSPGTASAVEAATNASGPTTPASTGKVNLMTPESFSTPSGRGSRSEKNKSDETVNPNVLSTLFMLANATKQQQAHMVSSSAALKATTAQPAQPPPAPPTVATLQAFVNMVQSRAATEEANSSKAPTGKQRKSTNGPMEGSEGAGSVSVPPEIPPMPSAEMLASGGSSPSREVQEIMSTKGSGTSMMVDDLFQFMCTPGQRKDVYDDEEEEEVELDVHTLSVAQGNTSNINHQFDEEDGVVQVTTNGQPEDTQDEVDAKEKMEGANSNAEEAATSSEEKAGDADAPAGDQMDQVSSTIGLLDAKEVAGGAGEVESLKDTAAAPFWPSKVPTELPESPLEVNNSLKRSSMPTVGGGSMTSSSSVPPAVLVVDSSKQLEALTGKLDCMMELLVAQSRQIEEMNGQLEAMKKAKNDEQRRYSALVNRLQQTLPKAIETQINSCFVSNSAKLEQSLLASLGSRQAQLLDALKQTVSQALMAQLPERVSALVIRDVQQKLLPPIASKLEVLQHTLSQDVVTQLRYFEVSIQEAIQRTIQSEQFVSKFSMNLSIAVHSDMRRIVEKAHEEAMRNRILPSYDASTQEMFRQITVCFSGGLKDFMRKIDEHIARVAETQVRANDLGELLRILPDKITASGDRSTANTVRMIREHLEKDMKMLQAPLLKTIRDHIRHEIEKGFEAQASSLEDSVLSVVRSQAQTPAPSNMDVQEQIKQYLNGGQINKAFHKALLSNDLSLVEFLLERADHKQVFNPCPLEQTVLLSLIQQISADMSNHNELKHKYLSDAIVNLDFHDPVTKEHSPKVMLELLTNCQAFMAANPTSSLCTSLKMVIIAIQYMGVKQF
uniref:Enhancer of mRNA-decapping protein 4 WD40 repeat region domain-containing protein n=1 Tax=Anopheles atroparvus TaxID=41427 RepID=A0AAG5DC22_ANOAO